MATTAGVIGVPLLLRIMLIMSLVESYAERCDVVVSKIVASKVLSGQDVKMVGYQDSKIY